MRNRSLLAWVAVGLAGLVLAAGVTYAATQLSSQRIGLSAEPPSAGEELAPNGRARAAPRRPHARGEDRGAVRLRTGGERGSHRRGGRQDD